jgi:hypothetical protein
MDEYERPGAYEIRNPVRDTVSDGETRLMLAVPVFRMLLLFGVGGHGMYVAIMLR